MGRNRKQNKKGGASPSCLIIIDGLGVTKRKRGNAYYAAGPLFLKEVAQHYPTALLKTHGTAVGLPKDVVGSSEVGHVNIGAGRIIEQDITIINREIQNGNFFKNTVLCAAMKNARKKDRSLHLVGLLSQGKVHADIGHLFALLKMACDHNIKRVYLHLFTDGRDMGQTSSIALIKKLERQMHRLQTGIIATIAGRHYAMDRIEHWERIGGVSMAIAHGTGVHKRDVLSAIREYHKQGIGDQFIPPTVFCGTDGTPCGNMRSGDSVVFFNLRSDRARALTKTFVKPRSFNGNRHDHGLRNLYFVALTDFGDDLPVYVAYDNSSIPDALPKILARADHLRQLYIAEEEKFPHITYFLHGLSSKPLRNENRIKIPSKNVITYDLYPAMSAREIGQEVVDSLVGDLYDFIGVNFANPDMVAHTGDMRATVKGIKTVDQMVKKIARVILKENGYLFIVSDHGNAEKMSPPGSRATATRHAKNPVHFSIVSNDKSIRIKKRGILADVAPTILEVMHTPAPKSWRKGLLR